MAGAEKKLTHKALQRDAKPREKPFRLSDGGGLFLAVMPNGARYWQFRYRFGGAERLYQIGAYFPHGQPGDDHITLEGARAEASRVREILRSGKDPVTERRLRKAEEVAQRNWTFEKAAEAWIEHNRKHWSAAHTERNEGLLRRVLNPTLAALPIARIPSATVLAALKAADAKGITESARRARAIADQVFAFAIVSGQAAVNPARDLTKAIRRPAVKHFAALSKDQLPALMVALDGDKLTPEVNAALRLMLYTALRDHELRGARWSEIDLEGGVWRVPAERMKRRTPHSVPLPTQAVEVLRSLRRLTYKNPASFVFASQSSKAGYLAENTLRVALHRLGFKVTAHGLRSLLTDTLNELGFRHDWIECQLHHAIQNATTAAYKRTMFIEQRKGMMQFWADYCDDRKEGKSHEEAHAGGNVFALQRPAIAA